MQGDLGLRHDGMMNYHTISIRDPTRLAAGEGAANNAHTSRPCAPSRLKRTALGGQEIDVTNVSGDGWLAGDAYEGYMGRWSRRLARAFVEWVGPTPSASWLEIGCGTGALTSTICNLCEPASIIACDPSASFVEHAREHLPDPRASFVVAGSEGLPYRDGGFDVAVSGLVLNFLPDPNKAVACIRERLRQGGTVAAYVWDYADGMEFLRLFWDESVALDPGAVVLHEGKRFPLCEAPALASLFRRGGLAQVETRALEIPTEFRRSTTTGCHSSEGLARLRATSRRWIAPAVSA